MELFTLLSHHDLSTGSMQPSPSLSPQVIFDGCHLGVISQPRCRLRLKGQLLP